MYKNFIACIYLSEKKAVKSLQDNTILSMDPVALAEYYSDKGADSILIFDQSYNDTTRADALKIIRQITNRVKFPVYGAGNIKSCSDAKALMEAGCEKIVLNFNKENTWDILESVSTELGRAQIAGTICSEDTVEWNRDDITKYVNELILLDEKGLRKCLESSPLPIITVLSELPLENMLAIMEQPQICGIAGKIVNENIKELSALKQICKERGIRVHTFEPPMPFSEFKLNSDGMIPVVTQDYKTGQVLMVAYMNEASYLATLRSGKMTYFSRSRQELWLKGETSGHYQYVKKLSIDCDNDTLLALVDQMGAACHTGNYSCFYRDIIPGEAEFGCVSVASLENIVVHQKDEDLARTVENTSVKAMRRELSDLLSTMTTQMEEENVTWEDLLGLN